MSGRFLKEVLNPWETLFHKDRTIFTDRNFPLRKYTKLKVLCVFYREEREVE